MNFHFLARALILDQNCVLLNKSKKGDYYYLPGGHIENFERIETALQREIFEELGIECKIGQYLGAVEQLWTRDNQQHYEINQIFKVQVPITKDSKVEALEPHIEFEWVEIDNLENINLLPSTLKDLIKQYNDGNKNVWWASN